MDSSNDSASSPQSVRSQGNSKQYISNQQKSGVAPPSKPKANQAPQGNLANLLKRDRDSLSIFSRFHCDEPSRPISAPPTEAIHMSTSSPNNLSSEKGNIKYPTRFTLDSGASSSSNLNFESDFRQNPGYAAFYYHKSRLDTRLPLPVYSPCYSWQVWNTSNPWNTSERRNSREFDLSEYSKGNLFSFGNTQESKTSNHSRKNLVQMIQEDFPRTPSPVYGSGSSQLDHSGITNSNTQVLEDYSHLSNLTLIDTDHIKATLRNLSLDSSTEFLNSNTGNGFENNHEISDFSLEQLTLFEGYNNSSQTKHSVNNVYLDKNEFYSEDGSQSNFNRSSLNSRLKYPSQNSPFSSKSGSSPVIDYAVSSGHERKRSNLLEEFRNNKTSRKFEVKDIEDHVVEFSGDQFGSRFIQQKLENSSLEDKELIFNEILPHAVELMTDVFGNYVIQKFLELGTLSQKTQLAKQMGGHVVPLSLQMYGCRVVQKALENVPVEDQEVLVKELDGHVVRCVKDQNGNHVIQKCIEKVPPFLIQFIVEAFKSQVSNLATHPYGCRVLQRIFEHCVKEQITPLLEEMHRFIPVLVQDQYGNYVVQHVLERGSLEDKSMIISKIRGQVLDFSRHKFASNVIEKCIVYGEPQDRHILVDEVVTERPDGVTPLQIMMKDPFANYVIQRMLDLSDATYREKLVKNIRPYLAMLRKYTYGKHIIAKVEKLSSEE